MEEKRTPLTLGSTTACQGGTDSAKVIRVIETLALRGSGTSEDLYRTVTQYWDFKGNFLAESDPIGT